MSDQTEFKGWARVEVMGHQSHIGYVETQVFGGTVLFRIDQPLVAGAEETLQRGEYGPDGYLPPGTIVKRGDIPAVSVLVGAASIYRIIPCDEATAIKAIRSSIHPPLIVVKMAESKALPSGIDAAIVGDDDEDEDDPLDESRGGGFF